MEKFREASQVLIAKLKPAFLILVLQIFMQSCKIIDPLPSTIKQSDLQGLECATAYSYVDYHHLTPPPSNCSSCKIEWTFPEDASIVETATLGKRVHLGTQSGRVSVKMISNSGIGNEVFIDLHVDREPGTYNIQTDVMFNKFNGLENPKCLIINGIPHVIHNANYSTSLDVYKYDKLADSLSLDYSFGDIFFQIKTQIEEIQGKWYFINSNNQIVKFDPEANRLDVVSDLPTSAGKLIFYAQNNKLYTGLQQKVSNIPLPQQYFFEFDPTTSNWTQSYAVPNELEAYGPSFA